MGGHLPPGGAPRLPLRLRWGCSQVSHDRLGWCSHCPRVSAGAELVAWRLVAAGAPAPDVVWARAVSACG